MLGQIQVRLQASQNLLQDLIPSHLMKRMLDVKSHELSLNNQEVPLAEDSGAESDSQDEPVPMLGGRTPPRSAVHNGSFQSFRSLASIGRLLRSGSVGTPGRLSELDDVEFLHQQRRPLSYTSSSGMNGCKDTSDNSPLIGGIFQRLRRRKPIEDRPLPAASTSVVTIHQPAAVSQLSRAASTSKEEDLPQDCALPHGKGPAAAAAAAAAANIINTAGEATLMIEEYLEQQLLEYVGSPAANDDGEFFLGTSLLHPRGEPLRGAGQHSSLFPTASFQTGFVSPGVSMTSVSAVGVDNDGPRVSPVRHTEVFETQTQTLSEPSTDIADVSEQRLLSSFSGKQHRNPSRIMKRSDSTTIDSMAESHDCVTFFFSDLVGFSTWASILPADRVMSTLNNLYSRLDDIITYEMPELYKVMKRGQLSTIYHNAWADSSQTFIYFCADSSQTFNNLLLYFMIQVETIGDAYIVAANLVTKDSAHAALMIRFELLGDCWAVSPVG